MHLADVAGLDEQPDLGAGLLADQVVVHGPGQQQRRDRRQLGGGVPVGEHDDAGAAGDRLGHLDADLVDPPRQPLAAGLDVVQAPGQVRLEAGHVALAVDVADLGQVVVGEDRERQHDLAARRRRRVEQVGLGADAPRERGDELLADRVEGRVGDLREQLAEVVEDQPWLRAQRRDRRVGAHRADRLGAGVGHRGEQDPQLLLGVAEDLLAPGDRGVGVHDVLALGHVVEVHQAGVQPLVVRVLGGQLGLDLLVLDDAVLVGVDEEHPARLEPALAHDPRLVDVEDADLGGEHDEAVVGHPVARGAQAVAVEDGADLAAVAEHHAGRPVPGLHQRGVELVEGAALGVHLGVVLPRLGDHHQHGVRQRAAAHVQQLEDLVERRGVRGAGRADRVEPLEVARDQVRVEERLAGPHPVAVAHHRVDLAVVGDVAERVRERPAREGVGREPGVHDRQRRGDPRVGEVGEEVVELVGGQHALVDEGARGERREVDVGLLLGPLAQAERPALQRHPGHAGAGAGHEDLHERRHRAAGGRAEDLGLHGHLAPAQDLESLLGGDVLEELAGLGHVVGVTGEEARADGVRVVGRQVEVDDLAQERVGDLEQDARHRPRS